MFRGYNKIKFAKINHNWMGVSYIMLWAVALISLVWISGPVSGQGTTDHYVIDTLVIVDATAFASWVDREPISLAASQRRAEAEKAVKNYTSLVIRQANSRLKTLTDENNRWSIELSISGFSIGVNPLSAVVNLVTGQVSATQALNSLRFWSISKNYGDQYDYVLLFTGYNLVGDTSLPYDLKGIANIGALCKTDGTSVAVVEDRGGFQSAHFVAHEFGHSLGTTHDGEPPNLACPDQDRYLMAINVSEVTSDNLLNPWHFSSCSKQTIGNFLQQTLLKDHAACLTSNMPPPDPVYEATANLIPGQEIDANQQCRNMYGPTSRLCLGGNFGNRSSICTSMYCLDPSSGSSVTRCIENRAGEGTTCGPGQLCSFGLCVDSPSAPSQIPADCYDTPVRINGQFSCSQHIPTSPASCYDEAIRTACCHSCQEISAKNSEVCPYGDKRRDCRGNNCNWIWSDGTRYEEVCCGTCSYDQVRRCTDDASGLMDGLTCGQHTGKSNDLTTQGCYNWTVAFHCCDSCQVLRRNETGCEYGDRYTACDRLSLTETSCRTFDGQQCCHSCQNLSLNGASRPIHTVPIDLALLFSVVSLFSYCLLFRFN